MAGKISSRGAETGQNRLCTLRCVLYNHVHTWETEHGASRLRISYFARRTETGGDNRDSASGLIVLRRSIGSLK